MEAEAAGLRMKLEPVVQAFDGAALAEALTQIKVQAASEPGRVLVADSVIGDWLVRTSFIEELGRSVTFKDDCGAEAQARALEAARAKVGAQRECMVQGVHRSASLRPASWVCDGATFNLN
jgi:hypothetical protein